MKILRYFISFLLLFLPNKISELLSTIYREAFSFNESEYLRIRFSKGKIAEGYGYIFLIYVRNFVGDEEWSGNFDMDLWCTKARTYEFI